MVEICNLKVNEWHMTVKRNFDLTGNIEENQSVVFSEFSDPGNNLASPIFQSLEFLLPSLESVRNII